MDSSKPRIAQAAIYPLGAEPPDDLSATTSIEERIAMMWPLALEAWNVSGRTLPGYRRAEMPGRVIIGGHVESRSAG
jgi:hypothetical protein